MVVRTCGRLLQAASCAGAHPFLGIRAECFDQFGGAVRVAGNRFSVAWIRAYCGRADDRYARLTGQRPPPDMFVRVSQPGLDDVCRAAGIADNPGADGLVRVTAQPLEQIGWTPRADCYRGADRPSRLNSARNGSTDSVPASASARTPSS
jgi:hypothetical protein